MSLDKQAIEALVRKAVERELEAAVETPVSGRLLDEKAVQTAASGSTLRIPPGMLVTPLARQAAMERKIKLVEGEAEPEISGRGLRTIALGADHGGYQMKEMLKEALLAADYRIVDCGTHSTDAVDYPDLAYAVARFVADGRAEAGIIVDGAGIGSCMAANKVPGVRAAMCYDQASAENSREHNHANVLTLGAGMIGPNLAKQIMFTWLKTEYGPGRHARRVEKIDQISERYSRKG